MGTGKVICSFWFLKTEKKIKIFLSSAPPCPHWSCPIPTDYEAQGFARCDRKEDYGEEANSLPAPRNLELPSAALQNASLLLYPPVLPPFLPFIQVNSKHAQWRDTAGEDKIQIERRARELEGKP